jgi:hypothetical protein
MMGMVAEAERTARAAAVLTVTMTLGVSSVSSRAKEISSSYPRQRCEAPAQTVRLDGTQQRAAR